MAIQKLLDDLAIISKLGDNPGVDNGLGSSAFRAKFDEAALKIQTYINDILVPALSVIATPENGMTMRGNINMNGYRVSGLRVPTADDHAASKEYVDNKLSATAVQLLASDWENNMQTVTVKGITSNSYVIDALAPDYENIEIGNECGVRCIDQGSNRLTFRCTDVPESDLTVNVMFWS